MNQIIEQLMKHRSIRKFKAEPVPEQMLESIISAGQMASTSSNVQAYSIISISDVDKRAKLMELAGNQAYVTESPVFLVWCADLYRLSEAAALHSEKMNHYTDSVENLLVATVDTALAAQNAAVAAESLGLGVVFIGGIRNHIADVAKELQLPELVYPLFGMCLGYPDQEPLLRPRLPLHSVLQHNSYDKELARSGISSYDQASSAYLLARSNGKTSVPWSVQMSKRLSEPVRLHMKSFLQERGFMKR